MQAAGRSGTGRASLRADERDIDPGAVRVLVGRAGVMRMSAVCGCEGTHWCGVVGSSALRGASEEKTRDVYW